VNTKRLECLGWKLVDERRQVDGRYRIVAESCGHFLICLAGNHSEALSAICSLAFQFTRGDLRLPSGCRSRFCPNETEPAADAFYSGTGDSTGAEDLITEYEELRRLAHESHVQAETVDQRLVEIERQLPDTYIFPGDAP
jgi:hypothetical protein